MGFIRFFKGFANFYGILMIFKTNFHLLLTNFHGFLRFPWISMDLNRFLWDFLQFRTGMNEKFSDFGEFLRICKDFRGFVQFSSILKDFYGL